MVDKPGLKNLRIYVKPGLYYLYNPYEKFYHLLEKSELKLLVSKILTAWTEIFACSTLLYNITNDLTYTSVGMFKVS